MLKTQRFAIERIYVPAKRRETLNSKIVREIAESMLEVGQQTSVFAGAQRISLARSPWILLTLRGETHQGQWWTR